MQNTTPGMRLKQLRLAHNLTQQELGEHIGLSNYYICRIESDQKAMSSAFAEKCANYFHVSPNFLLTGLNPPDLLEISLDTPGKRLRQSRLEADLSQKELSWILGITAQQISNYENDLQPISAKTARLLSERLDIDNSWLYTGISAPDHDSKKIYLDKITTALNHMDLESLNKIWQYIQHLKKE